MRGRSVPDLSAFHFLRPAWLALVPLAVGLAIMAGGRLRAARQWRGHIAPHLLPYLVVRPPRSPWPGPRAWFGALAALSAIALAGPSWQREPPPFADDRGMLVIVLDLSPSMNALDVQPTRLARAKQKLGELLAMRQSARTALVVFAGSAHRVMPATDDAATLKAFLDTLETSVMPPVATTPARWQAAMAVAQALIERDAADARGTVLVVSDGNTLGAIERHDSPAPAPVLWLFGDAGGAPLANDSRGAGSGLRAGSAPPRDADALAAWVDAGGIDRVDATVGDADVAQVHRRIEQQLGAAAEAAADRQWRDEGQRLLWPLVLLAALGFRRGWSLPW